MAAVTAAFACRPPGVKTEERKDYRLYRVTPLCRDSVKGYKYRYNQFLLCVSKLLFVVCLAVLFFLGLLINYCRFICYLLKFLSNYV